MRQFGREGCTGYRHCSSQARAFARALLVVGVLIASCLAGGVSQAAQTEAAACTAESLRSIAPPGVTIADIPNLFGSPGLPRTSNGVAHVPADALGKGSPEFCLVTGTMVTHPQTHKTAHFAAGLPSRRLWNDKFLFQGCGYNCGIVLAPSIGQIGKGYPVWSTDDGHIANPGPNERLAAATDATWATLSPGRSNSDAVSDFMYRAVHTVTEIGKVLTSRFYAATRLEHSYFIGCSDGGREGMVELSRFPNDYDGIVAGAPYFDMSNEILTTLVGIQAQLRTRNASIPLPLYAKLGREITARCDAADGTSDGLIQDPARCGFDPERDLPRCTDGSDTSQCFSPEQIDTLNVIFSAITKPSGQVVYPGWSISDPQDNLALWLGFHAPANDTNGPDPWSDNPGQQPLGWYWSSGTLKHIVYDAAPGFNPLKTPGVTFGRDPIRGYHAIILPDTVTHITHRTQAGSGATPSDAAAYLRQGRKLIMYHGYSDGLITPYRTIQYYRSLASLHGGYGNLQRDAELFMVPNMGHCWGGPGPNVFGQTRGIEPGANGPTDAQHDVLTALERWVEDGERPARLIATKYENDDASKPIVRSMPLCPFPAMARYAGKGDINEPANWSCSAADASLDEAGPVGVRAGVNAPLH